jgi:hypothetical protein
LLTPFVDLVLDLHLCTFDAAQFARIFALVEKARLHLIPPTLSLSTLKEKEFLIVLETINSLRDLYLSILEKLQNGSLLV